MFINIMLVPEKNVVMYDFLPWQTMVYCCMRAVASQVIHSGTEA